MVRELGFISCSKARKKVFENRAETLLKLARDLATLCDTPACIVIHNPEDVTRPWRIWPEREAELRNMIQLYKSKKGIGCEGSNRTETIAPPISSRTIIDRSVDSDGVSWLNGLSTEQAMSAVADVDRKIAEVQKRIDSETGKTTRPAEVGNNLFEVVEQDLAVVETGNEEDANQFPAPAAVVGNKRKEVE